MLLRECAHFTMGILKVHYNIQLIAFQWGTELTQFTTEEVGHGMLPYIRVQILELA